MKLATQIKLGFLIAISIDLLDSFVNYTLTWRVRTNSDFLNRSEAVIRHSSSLDKGVLQTESAFRGFLLTGQEPFLVSYQDGVKNLPQVVREEKSLGLQPTQQRLLDSIISLHDHWLQYADGLITAKRQAVIDQAHARAFRSMFDKELITGAGRAYNDRIMVLIRQFDNTEYRKRDERRAALSTSIDRTDRYSLFFSLLLIVIGISIASYLVRKISARIHSQVALADRISRGDFGKVADDKKDELSSLSVSLNLMSERLSRNISELEKKNKELNDFAYVVSHDLKAPVRGIANVVQWINEDLEAEISTAMRKYLDFIVDRLRRMEGLIAGLLEYARAGRGAAVFEEVNAGQLIHDLVDLIVPKGCSVHVGAMPTFYTERLPLQQVLSNLISNAIKYTPSGSGIVEVTCKEENSWYEFSVRDNGPGISPEYHEKVFGLFQTLREKEDKESTGIGLAIVKKIVEERGGSVRLVSDVGGGANFIFTWLKHQR